MVGVGLLGCGTIGTQLAEAVCAGEAGDAEVVALFDQDIKKASSLAEQLPASVSCFETFDQFLSAPRMELVVECATPKAVVAHAEALLAGGKDLLLMSSGALTDTSLFQRLSRLAQQNGRRLMMPSGALGGIDAMRAVRHQLDEVTLTTTKAPRSLQGAPGFREWESREIAQAEVIFEGTALEAVRLFPANVNVAATLGLSGIGPEKTRVKVVADPQSPGNVHEIAAKGRFGVLRFRMELRPHERNPRTSALAILSAIEALRSACSQGPRIGT